MIFDGKHKKMVINNRRSRIFPLLWIVLLLAIECSAYYYTEPFDNSNNAYRFSYQTGNHDEPNLAQSFREESRDEYGNVHGKYGYVDPYGRLRFV